MRGVEIAGENGVYFPANAIIVNNALMVNSPLVSSPVSVRYAWADNPDASSFNSAGLPAAPFTATKSKKLDL